MSYNHATKYGGGIYHEDNIASAAQCSYEKSTKNLTGLTSCFLMQSYEDVSLENTIHSLNNSAGINGTFLHGGLLDRCKLITINKRYQHVGWFRPIFRQIDYITPFLKAFQNEITSQPYRLCFCENNTVYTCSTEKHFEIYPGQKFRVSLMAFDQLRSISTWITAVTTYSWLANANQAFQRLNPGCSDLYYSLYSTDKQDMGKILLYADGPCHDTGLTGAVVSVTFRPCPDGFNTLQTDYGEKCVCIVTDLENLVLLVAPLMTMLQ